ncbi:MAG: DUF362 domain-containing protein [Candidatus Bathyarchaeota archaeon]|nr:DUF362 domain-containing protein [Candidatus Bathyarchaeota archaeon]
MNRRCRNRVANHIDKRKFFFVGLLSLIWLVFRSGTRPSRIVYPCQRVALANVQLWFLLYIAPLICVGRSLSISSIRRFFKRRKLSTVILASCIILASFTTVWFIIERSREVSVELSIEGRLASRSPSSDIFVVVGTNGYDEGFRRLIELMSAYGVRFYKSDTAGEFKGPDGLIARDDVVIIKVNSQWDERGGTNTDLLKAVIEAIVSHPDGFIGEIVVADNGQAQYGPYGTGGSLNWDRNNAEDRAQSVQKVVDTFSDRYKVSTYLWDSITLRKVQEYSEGDMEDGYIVYDNPDPKTGIIVSYPKFKTKFGTHISFKHGLWNPESKSYCRDKLKVINMPVLKTHSIYGVTACIKHYMGIPSDKLTQHNPHISVGSGGMGTLMAETRFPTLNILDAIWINPHPRSGPRTSYSSAVKVGIIAASLDPIALDYWASKNILMKTASILGYRDLSSMDPDNVSPGSFGSWLRLSMEALRTAGYRVVIGEEYINVYVHKLQG